MRSSFIVAIVAGLLAGSAQAKQEPCSHPIFVEKGCERVAVVGPKGAKGDRGPQGPKGERGETGAKGSDGLAGRDGIDGVGGRDGIDGVDGRDGKDGAPGRDGIDGRDGKEGRDGVDYFGHEYRNLRKEFSNFIAASNSIQVHLPRTKANRVTANVLYVDNTAGVGFGYARSLDENSDLTFGVGTAGGEYVFQLGVSGEF